jgi:hypothetical protein
MEVTDAPPERAHPEVTMNPLHTFQITAHESGFVDVREYNAGTVIWLRRKTQDPISKTHQRICMDSLTASATVYWTDSLGKADSKTFRAPNLLREWLAKDLVR